MKKIEVDLNLKLPNKETARLELHSFQNVMTVLSGELQFLGALVGSPEALQDSRTVCDDLIASINNLSQAVGILGNWNQNREIIIKNIDQALKNHTPRQEHIDLIKHSTSNINRVLDVIDDRVKEYLERINSKENWQLISISDIESDLRQVLDAMAYNSRGRFRIVYEKNSHSAVSYLINLKFSGKRENMILMPPILLDVLRDLVANARKYTLPGGIIKLDLHETEKELKLTVSDNGRGIPENEMENVVRFGVRGSNTKAEEAKGGGYGLTKAYWVCKKYGGRMWIESEVGRGTKIEIRIPISN